MLIDIRFKRARSLNEIAWSLSGDINRLLSTICTTTIVLIKNIRMCSVLINGRASLARAKFTLNRRVA
jgi:hypothetical protein